MIKASSPLSELINGIFEQVRNQKSDDRSQQIHMTLAKSTAEVPVNGVVVARMLEEVRCNCDACLDLLHVARKYINVAPLDPDSKAYLSCQIIDASARVDRCVAKENAEREKAAKPAG
jgi:hypothetical protein